jgi:uncharacterized membrane protein
VEKGRLEAFSDGVFAVAITLLVLSLAVPGPGVRNTAGRRISLVHQLGTQWPSFAAFVVSFLVIGIMWVNHHTLLGKLARVDRTMLFLNLLLLLFVTTIPFPTHVFAQYLRAGGWDAKVAAALYSAVMEAAAISFNLIYWWAGHKDELLHEHVDAEAHRAAFRQFSVGTIVYLALIGVSFLSAVITLLIHFVIAVFYVFDRTAAREAA